jgi:hypothetical protein
LVVDLEGTSKPIEEIQVGEMVLARNEFEPHGPLELKRVEELFTRTSPIIELEIGGQKIGTTEEHPFYVPAREAFVPARELQVGDQLISHDGQLLRIDAIHSTLQIATVYNLRVADYHTYFVGCDEWGWSVWAHNVCTPEEVKQFANAYASKVAANGGKTPKGLWTSIGNGRQFSQSEKRQIRTYLRDPANNFPATSQPKLRNQRGKPGNLDHDATVEQLKKRAAAEFPNDAIVTGKNIKHQPGKANGVSLEPDVWVMDTTTREVKMAYEAARTNADGISFKSRETIKQAVYEAAGIPVHFQRVR